jgi:hypothetical protein
VIPPKDSPIADFRFIVFIPTVRDGADWRFFVCAKCSYTGGRISSSTKVCRTVLVPHEADIVAFAINSFSQCKIRFRIRFSCDQKVKWPDLETRLKRLLIIRSGALALLLLAFFPQTWARVQRTNGTS